ncbi:MAG: V-type ATP synthase subunit D [Candidatus Paceibacterota bacterium]
MAIRKVTPTRLTLLTLKKELGIATKGHKLLKDKRDGLVQTFMEKVHETRSVREEVNQKLPAVFTSYVKASASVARKTHELAFLLPSADLSLEVKERSIMSVKIPEFSIKKNGSPFSYGLLETSGELDNALAGFEEVFPLLVRLAHLEKTLENLAKEIERTRRRVSALENIRIPELEETISYISNRLEEQSRDAVVSTMRIKAMIEEKQES